VRRAQLGAAAVPVLAAALAIGDAAGGGVGMGAGVGAVVVLAGAAYWFLARRISAWGYAEREDDLLVRRGLLFRRLSIIPYGRMQYVDVTAGPFERAFGLATVRMYTAAAASDARIPGLEAGDAAHLRDSLTELGEARAAGL
jgi:membrane protein YdbS with pleckstrin-like domain